MSRMCSRLNLVFYSYTSKMRDRHSPFRRDRHILRLSEPRLGSPSGGMHLIFVCSDPERSAFRGGQDLLDRARKPHTGLSCMCVCKGRRARGDTNLYCLCVAKGARHYSMHTTWHGIDSCSHPSPSSSPLFSLSSLFGRCGLPGSSRCLWRCCSGGIRRFGVRDQVAVAGFACPLSCPLQV